MKNLLPILILLTLTTSSFGQFWKSKPKSTPTPAPTPALVITNTKQPIQEARSVINELNSELKQARESNTELKKNLVAAENKVKNAEEQTLQVQKNADALKAWGIEQQNQAFRWLDKYTSTVKRYHRLKTIAAIVSALFGAMLGMYCMRLIPPVYAAYAFTLPIAGAILAFGGVWLFF
jgi:VIT1/CCC1 family predicted Fe2+/Mn2+ transporter